MNVILFECDELIATENAGGPADEPSQTGGALRFHGTLSPRDRRAVHLRKVLRKKEGEDFEAGLIGGNLGRGIIKKIDPGGIDFFLTLKTEPPPRIPLRLGVGFPRPIQLRRLLRDCATLGLLAVDLICTELGEKSYRDTKLLDDGGARSALLEGIVQARDTRLPDLAVYPSLDVWLSRRPWEPGPAAGQTAVPDMDVFPAPNVAGIVRAGRPLLAAADNLQPRGSFAGLGPLQTHAVLAVGSERGWSNRERESLEKTGFLRLSLGSRALRTETACVAAVILLMEKMGVLNC
ncbi:MAG: 16S rRNA (uracil(1498)-N(3))-methyltransferase [Spirochaetaceae bacterium]|nr:16S rRNA (uracil(1498)-N(3))-methyltransferase [Spirochaetaceae bacterium]